MDVSTYGGVTTYTIHQSDLGTYTLCPERARQLWWGEADDFTSAEAAIGTATHTAIERLSGGDAPSDALEAAIRQFRDLSEASDFRWVKVKTAKTSEQHITNCFNTWLRDIWRHLGEPLAVELSFDLEFSRRGRTVIRLAGCIDFIDETSVYDWKTCSRLSKFTLEGWQLQRWGIQPGPYTWAAHQLGYFEDTPVPFTWVAMQRTPCVSGVLTTTRGPREWGWLEEQCWNVVNTYESASAPWPTNDQHALCSADWCPAWGTCKGAVLAYASTPQLVTL